METRRWLNQSHPQTLYMATILLYLSAVLGLLFGAVTSPIGLATVVGFGAAAYGMANDRRWGYYLAVGMTGLQMAVIVLFVAANPDRLFDLLFLANIVFPVALFLLLIHPQSRGHQRIWFS